MNSNTSSIQEPGGREVIALDVGGTRSRAALVRGGEIVWRADASTPAQAGPQAMTDAMAALIHPLAGQPACIGVAIAGQVVNGCVTAHNAGLLRSWTDFPLTRALSERTGRQVRVLNDARAAAWAEHLRGAGRGCSEFLFVTVSTGVGAGLVLDGRLHLAANGMDAELGEALAADGQTLEAIASGTAMGEQAVRLGHRDARALFDAADAGDAGAERVVRDGIRALALKLADLSVMLGIQRTAVGGGVGLRPGYVERLREELHRLPRLYQHEIIRAELGADAGLHGAAALAHGP
ncbi:ROK family protein [Piscinibacter terrae]|uniref:ROK family protein n=1 Tax=Piscinibacter terrae TaxID=2496871 RepID=UPI0018E06A88|nr:ROK family protein [Albitalea terrae]